MRWQTVQTQLLLRGGPRTPKWKLPPEAFWQAALPVDDLLQQLARAGQERGGPRRKRTQKHNDLWGAFTTRGADEGFAVGRRLRAWLDDSGEMGRELMDTNSQDDAHSLSNVVPTVEAKSSEPIMVYCRQGHRPGLTARAVLRGLCLPGQHAIVDTNFDDQLQVQSVADVSDPAKHNLNDANAWRDVTDELSSVLKLNGYFTLASGGWPQLLDAAECASAFGLLPHGQLPESVWQRLRFAPQLDATALLQDRDKAAEKLGPLLRLVFTECTKAAHQAVVDTPSEKVQLYILPGFSLFCFARALSLKGAVSWPERSAGLLLETLLDAQGEVFIRFWHPRDMFELRPSWHRKPGPVPLSMVLEILEASMGVPLPWLADSLASVSLGLKPQSGDSAHSCTS